MKSFLQDVRYGFRTLSRTPGFTVVALAVLSLGIGVNATVFTLANACFLRPLPVFDPATVVRISSNRFSATRQRTYLELRDRNSTLAGLAAFQFRSFGLRIDADTEHVFGEIVSGDYFQTLGVTTGRGRLLAPSDDRDGAAPVVVLSHGFWIRRFAGSPDAIGRTIALNDQAFTVVGVAPTDFTGMMTPLRGELWVPLAADALLRPALDRDARLDSTSLHLAGRLRAGVVRARAQADLEAIGQQLRLAAGETSRGPAVSVYDGTVLHPEISPPITAFTAVLMTLVALVLLIVCVNMANLVLARAAGRDVELAVRQSLGAGRGRLIRQLLTESLLLSFGGAAGGLALAFWAARLLMSADLPTPVPIAFDLTVDPRVLAFTALVASGATLVFGTAPAIGASRIDLVRALKGTRGDGPGQGRLRAAFLVAQVSMSVLLLVVAGLFIRGFRHAQSIDLGFDASQVLTASIDLETRGYQDARGREVIRVLTDRLETTPGVVSANLVDIVPVTLSNRASFMLRDQDAEPARGQPPPMPLVYSNAVGPGHFRTLRIPLVAGRDFTGADGDDMPRVAIVNETLARLFWPGKSAMGQRLRPPGRPDPRSAIEIVGVVRDSKYVTVGEDPRPFMYVPLAQAYTPHITLLVRTTGTFSSALTAIKEVVRSMDPGLAVFNVATLAEATSLSLLPARIAGSLLGALGMLALALAALGIYGVLSFLVRSRTREIGVRVAIGATPRDVATMVVRQAMIWTAAGALIGIVLSVALTRFLSAFLYGISATDPLAFGGATLVLAIVAGIAATVPAVRASRLDPLMALRNL